MPHLAGRLLERLAFVSTIRGMVFHASAGGCALPGGRAKNRAALLSPEPETSSRTLNKATPPTVADHTGRSPPATPTPRGGLVARPVLYPSKTKAYRQVYMKYPE